MGELVDKVLGKKEKKIHDEKNRLTGQVLQKEKAANILKKKAEESLRKIEELVSYRIYISAGGRKH